MRWSGMGSTSRRALPPAAQKICSTTSDATSSATTTSATTVRRPIANRRSLPGGSRPPSLLAAGRVDPDSSWGRVRADLGMCFKFYDMHGYGWDFDGAQAPEPPSALSICRRLARQILLACAKPEQGLARGTQAVRRRAAEGSCSSTASATRNARARSVTGTTGDASGRMSSSCTTRSATVRAKPVESCATASFERSRMHL